ncbi:4Fe-4S binding protein [Heliophilum fasciatum]|uniref:4Fe-4S binding protein n=1 Tax=Heliophilum fasciatum TaxID=35700 RepID=A0A4R2RZD9_9FIRM|nr:4Fe-4S binding protein [Heliophilum fasciatum]MCW2276604.1 ferredoxin [Heliophilum fasciatum]TCP69013.1 4Fe-4S binding protein [Heliophilum fasciatum]
MKLPFKINKEKTSLLHRGIWYAVGLLLFFAPFAYYVRGVNWLLGTAQNAGVHSPCFRMPIQNLLEGKGLQILTVGGLSTILLVLSALLVGPFFCGRLCATGALPEYIGRLVPDAWKINLHQEINPVPIRYGFLVGFALTPFFAGSIACAFCNFTLIERLTTGGLWGDVGYLGSTTIITAIIWLLPLGIFAQGGRGFCSFLCPVGAVQSAIHSVGRRLGFTYKLKLAKAACVSCSACVKACPMGALRQEHGELHYQVHTCVTCRHCVALCPTKALTFGTGAHGWGESAPEQEPAVQVQLIKEKA